MLERLTIRDLALVEHVELAFGPGLHALTGETGAGKSLLVDALGLLVGQRADADVVREGAKAAVVEAEFRLAGEAATRARSVLESFGLALEDDTLIVRREVSAEGRSRASVNQSSVTLASLKRLTEGLLDLHGQHEHQWLLRDDAAIASLDRLAGLEDERARYAEALAALREAEGDLERLESSLATYAERRDYLLEAARELDEAKLEAGEDDALRSEAQRLAHADRLRSLVQQAIEQLSEAEHSALASLASARHATEQAAAIDASLEPALASARDAAFAAEEAAQLLADYADRLEADPERLESVESRRELLARLTRRYRRTLEELIAWRPELARELGQGEDAEGARERAALARAEAERSCLTVGRALSQRRRSAASEWSNRLTRELAPLGFAHARIAFEVSGAADGRPGPTGLDQVELAFTPNPGESARPLARIASGGELSRVMLALECALQARDRVGVLVFDEVDSGIGGAVAQAVGERLRDLARHAQVLCITHLPILAALAQHHLVVRKQVTRGRTTARITTLEPAERVEELARMLAGERVTDTTRRQAEELLATPSGRRTR